MVRPGKLKTRQSTLGATRNERILSAMNSHAANSIYNNSSRKTENNSRKRGGRIRGYPNEQRDEYVPSSITMESQGYARSPKLDYTTSSSITTRSSLQPKQQRNQSPSKLKRSLSLRKQSSREPPSPSNMRRSVSVGRQYSRDQSEASSNLRQSSSKQSSSRQSSRDESPARNLIRSSSRQSSRGQSPARNLIRSSSRQSSRGQSPARNLIRSSSRQSSRGQSPARNLRRSSSRQSSRDPSPSHLRQPLSRQSSRDSRQSPSDPSQNLNMQYSRDSRQAESRQSSRAASRSRSRPRSVTPSLKSSVLSNSTKNASNEPYEEKVELVAMTNEHNQSFVRILVSKTSYKPKMGDGVEVVPDSEVTRSQAARLAHRRGKGIARGHSFKRKQKVQNQKAIKDNHVSDDEPVNQEERTEENDEVSPTTTDERDDEIIHAPNKEVLNPPIMDICDDVDLAMTAINAITACTSPADGSFQVESKTATSSRKTKSTPFVDPSKVIRIPLPEDKQDDRDGVNAENYYGMHSLKKSSSRRKLFSFKSEDSADRIAKKEKAKEEKKQKKIQKRLDKEAKKQIKKELYRQDQLNRELYKQKQEQMRLELQKQEQRERDLHKQKKELYKQKQEQLRREQFKQEQMKKELYRQEQMRKKAQEKEMRRSNSFNSAVMKKINYVTRSRSDDKIYEKSYQDTFPRVAVKQPWEETYPQLVTNKSSGSSRSGIFQKLRASLSMDQEAGVPVRNVSFVSEGDPEDRKYGYAGRPEHSYRSGASSRGTEAMQGTIHDMGGVFACGAMTQDVRETRMVDSDISSSGDEDDSSESSSGYHYYTTIR